MTIKRGWIPLLVAAPLFVGPATRAQDEPDLNREKRLNQVYKRFNSKPTSPEKWNQAVLSANAATYNVQQGDTLWDISETFFGDPEFWPKIWSLNDSIGNPHEIKPSEQVQFTPGSLGQPPTIGVVAKADANANAENAAAVEGGAAAGNDRVPEAPKNDDKPWHHYGPTPHYAEADLSAIPLPPKTEEKKPTAFPPSVPAWSQRQDPYKTMKVELTRITRTGNTPELTMLSYPQEGELVPQGHITECEGGMNAAHENQYVTVKLNNGSAGQKFLVVKTAGHLSDTAGDNDASIVQIQGELQVAESVNPEEQLYRALVVRAFEPVLTGDELITGEVQRVVLDESGAPVDAQAHVIGGPGHDRRHIFATGEVLFLDGGAKAGLNTGQKLNVYRIEKVRNSDTDQTINPRVIGSLKVLRTTDRFAVAAVVSETEEINVGDSTTKGAQVQ